MIVGNLYYVKQCYIYIATTTCTCINNYIHTMITCTSYITCTSHVQRWFTHGIGRLDNYWPDSGDQQLQKKLECELQHYLQCNTHDTTTTPHKCQSTWQSKAHYSIFAKFLTVCLNPDWLSTNCRYGIIPADTWLSWLSSSYILTGHISWSRLATNDHTLLLNLKSLPVYCS